MKNMKTMTNIENVQAFFLHIFALLLWTSMIATKIKHITIFTDANLEHRVAGNGRVKVDLG